MFDLDGLINDTEEVQELQAFKGTEEVKIRVTGVRTGTDKNSLNYFMPNFELVDEVGYKEFNKFYHVPDRDAMDAKKYNTCLLQLKRLVAAFDVDLGSMFDREGVVQEEALVGGETWAILGVEDRGEYGEQNYIKKFSGN